MEIVLMEIIDKSKFKIDFIGVAALRSGTTWISRCLAEHPQVCFSSKKEINFFRRNYVKGIKHHQSFFKGCLLGGKIKGEYTAAYYISEEAARRIKKHFPDVKILACLRNPIERVLSHYRWMIRRGEKVNSNIWKELSKHRFIPMYGFYYQHLSKFLKHFNQRNVLILIYEDALSNPAEFIKSIYQFLKIDESFIPPSLYKKINTTPKKGKMDKKTRENLRQLYKDDIKKLEKLLGRDLSFWK